MAEYVYRMAYPILDEDLRMSQVINQATLIFAEDAEERGIRILGDITTWIDEYEDDRVYCEAAAEIIEMRQPRMADLHGLRVAALNALGMTDGAIAEELGLSSQQTVQRIRTALGLPPNGKRAA